MPIQNKRIFVREVKSEDKEHNALVHKLINEAFRSDESWTTDRSLVGTDRISLEDFNELIEKNGNPNVLLYAVDGDIIVGVIQIVPNKEKGSALLSMLAVGPTHQSKGVGGLLVRESNQYIKENMPYIKESIVHVFESRTELLSWYKRLGFQDNNEVIPFPFKEILIVDEAPLVVLRYPIKTIG